MANGRFQDNPSQPFWYRKQPVPAFKHSLTNGRLHIETDHLQLSYEVGRPFQPDTLHFTLKSSGTVWHFGYDDPQILHGTYRQLAFGAV